MSSFSEPRLSTSRKNSGKKIPLTVVPVLPLGRVPVLPYPPSTQMVFAPPPVEALTGIPFAGPRFTFFETRPVFEVLLPLVSPLVQGTITDLALGPLVGVLDAAVFFLEKKEEKRVRRRGEKRLRKEKKERGEKNGEKKTSLTLHSRRTPRPTSRASSRVPL